MLTETWITDPNNSFLHQLSGSELKHIFIQLNILVSYILVGITIYININCLTYFERGPMGNVYNVGKHQYMYLCEMDALNTKCINQCVIH